jgi:hypothetical protein
MTSTIPSGNGTRRGTGASHSSPPTALQLLRQPDIEIAVSPDAEKPTSPQLPPLASPPVPAAWGLFSAEQTAALAAPLNRAHVQTRSQAGRPLSYLEGWVAIQEANRIFGFDGWQRETIELRCVAENQRQIGRDQKRGWGVTYIAKVRIRLGSQAIGMVALVREGCGAGHGIDIDLGLAHESALKEAETDAMKRALMTFGNPFGLALYDKQQRQVTSSGRESQAIQGRGAFAPAGQSPRLGKVGPTGPMAHAVVPERSKADTSAIALAPEEIQQLHNALSGLARPQLEALVTAFRQRFHLGEGESVAAAITQKQHHDWIEAYLVQVEAPKAGSDE